MEDFGFEEYDGKVVLWTKRRLGPSFLIPADDGSILFGKQASLGNNVYYYDQVGRDSRSLLIGILEDFFQTARTFHVFTDAGSILPDGLIAALEALDVFHTNASTLGLTVPGWDTNVNEKSPIQILMKRLVQHPTLRAYGLCYTYPGGRHRLSIHRKSS